MKGDRTIHPRVLDYAYTGTDVLYKEFHISQKGYSDEQVEASRGQYGKNIVILMNVVFWSMKPQK